MNDRLAAALTRNKARKMLPEFLEVASAALHRVVQESDLISAAESAALLQVFNQKMAQLRQGEVTRTSMLFESDVALEERSRR